MKVALYFSFSWRMLLLSDARNVTMGCFVHKMHLHTCRNSWFFKSKIFLFKFPSLRSSTYIQIYIHVYFIIHSQKKIQLRTSCPISNPMISYDFILIQFFTWSLIRGLIQTTFPTVSIPAVVKTSKQLKKLGKDYLKVYQHD